ncbi:MAG: HD domain-containing protein [archaeon]|nr:HD domain-containing protein [archaeon]
MNRLSKIVKAKEILFSQVEKIKDIEIKNFVINALNEVHEDFWLCESSSSGKYHPSENQGTSGLIRHVLKCILIVEEFCTFMNFSKEDRDILIASAILHDVKKHGEPWGKHTHHEHPKIGADYLKKFNLNEDKKTRILNCVRYHYGNYTRTLEDKERALNLTKEESVLHIADVLASRTYMSWLPGVSVSDEERDSFFDKFLNEFGGKK